MPTFMTIVSLVVFLFAILGSLVAQTMFHSIYAAIFFVVSAIFWTGAAILEAIGKHTLAMSKQAAAVNKPRIIGPTKPCSYCDAEVSVGTKVCPACGKPA